ncbi:MAG: NAD(P)-dependent glycerol-3-phosphate dehydrogenase [Planctomycetaceae bacterium]|nr:NAD(P)-dependent glycerol-3-phosphate dehydrogenase [Planctomycetaceae bacterium]
MTTQKVAVIGGGAMGTACALVLSHQANVSVGLWVRNPTFARHIAETRENSRLLPSVRLPDCVTVSSDAAQILSGAAFVVVCVPTRGLRDALGTLHPLIPNDALLVSAVKGIEIDTLRRPSEILTEVLGTRPVVVFGGPCHAEEVARRFPASVVAASDCADSAVRVQELFSTDFLRVYTNSDQSGVELAGALKNVIAIAAGICDGLQFGDNAKAALMTRGLAEMTRFGRDMGARVATFSGLAGIGDLVTTCYSRHSRNRNVGELLGRGQTLDEIQASTHAVAEGVFTARSVTDLAAGRGIELPIAEEVRQVLFDGKSPAQATEDLMKRPLKEE